MIEATKFKISLQFLILLGATSIGVMGCGYGLAKLPDADVVRPQAEGNQDSAGKADLVLAHAIIPEKELRILAHTPYLILDSIEISKVPNGSQCRMGMRFMLRTVKGAQFTLTLLDKNGKQIECKTHREDVGPEIIPSELYKGSNIVLRWNDPRYIGFDFPPDIIKTVASFKLEVTHY